MADTKPKKITRTTPLGVFKWPKFVAPDTYKDKKAFKTAFTLPADHEWVAKAIRAIDKLAEETLAAAVKNDKRNPAKIKQNPWTLASKPYGNEVDKEGNETGRVEFRFKANYEGTRKDGTKWTHKGLKLFDGQGKKFALAEDPWSGSEGCVSFEMRPFAQGADVGAGVSLSIEAVQITKLVQGGDNKSADDYGFGKHDGGFEADTAPTPGSSSDDDEGGNAPLATEENDDF